MTQLGTTANPLRVAVIGAGPSGFYAADHLLKQKALAVEVDLFDRLPTPYGLVRGGVAPGGGLFVAELETGIDGDRLPARPARQQRHLQALAQGERPRAGGDILRRRLERLARSTAARPV